MFAIKKKFPKNVMTSSITWYYRKKILNFLKVNFATYIHAKFQNLIRCQKKVIVIFTPCVFHENKRLKFGAKNWPFLDRDFCLIFTSNRGYLNGHNSGTRNDKKTNDPILESIYLALFEYAKRFWLFYTWKNHLKCLQNVWLAAWKNFNLC